MATASAKTVQIVRAPAVRGGRARIDGSRICVVDVVQAHKSGRSPEEIRVIYQDLNLAQIHAAHDRGWEEEHERRRVEYIARHTPK